VTGSDPAHTFEAARGPGERPRDGEAGLDLDTAYRLYASDVSRWLRQLAGMSDVSDLLHEVFVVAQRKSAGFRGEASVRTWLYAIAHRVVSGWRRKQRLRRLLFWEPQAGADMPEAIDTSTPFSELSSRHATHVVKRVLERLSERDRTLIICFEIEGLSAAEIQTIVGLSPNAVWVALHRARERFRKIFVDLYGSEE
jgi:RNA polymerase sigma-70 factor (ECF subfamily)